MVFITHPACREHLTAPEHPERPDRLLVIERALEHERLMFLQREQCPIADLDTIGLCHRPAYIERIPAAAPAIGIVALDQDTMLSTSSFEASLRAGRRHFGSRRGHDRKGKERVRGDSAGGSSCSRGHRRGILPLQQRSDSPPVMLSGAMVPSAPQSSTSTPITATARSKFSGATGQ
jgi:hypothetical protein